MSTVCQCGHNANEHMQLVSGGSGPFLCTKCGCIAFVQSYSTSVETINHPSYYGGDTTYEAIKVIEAWQLGFCLGNAIKYISRAGKKDPAKEIEDLEKARFYLSRKIDQLKLKKESKK